jgi:serine/threonine-protein kinase
MANDSDETRSAESQLAVGETLPLSSAPTTASLSRGTTIDRYVILDYLDLGSKDVVYAAYDPELNRKLAIKIPSSRAPSLNSAHGHAQLLREAQAMARLRHDNVVGVYGVGTFQEHAFVAMEFLDGMTLARWLRREERSWREVLEAFVQAARGLAAAHAVGIVHGDFKPDNAIVGKDGRVRVLDFAGTPAALTRSEALLKTPSDMSPEQGLSLPPDAHSDQFSFCVALHQALTEARPFAGDDAATLASAVLKGQPRPLPDNIPLWLKRVIQRGLQVKPDERYTSMDALVHALSSDPEVKRRRRRRLAVNVTAFVALAGAAIFGIVNVARARANRCRGMEGRLVGIWDATRKAALRSAFVATGKSYSAETAERVTRMLDSYVASWVKARTDACAATHVRGEQAEKLLDLRMACFDRRLKELSALTSLFTRAPDTGVVNKAVDATSHLTRLEGCADTRALEAVIPPPDDQAARAKVEELRKRLAEVKALRESGRFQDGLRIANEAAKTAENLQYAPIWAEALFLRAYLEDATGNYAAAEKTYYEALLQSAEGRDDALAARTWAGLIFVIQERQARYQEALLLAPYAELALLRIGNEPGARARLDQTIGDLLEGVGRYSEAQSRLERSLAAREKLLGPNHPDVASTLNSLAIVFEKQGNYVAAERAYRQTLAICETIFGREHPRVSLYLNNLGVVLRQQGRDEEARRVYERALSIAERALGSEHAQVGRILDGLGEVLFRLGSYDQALAMLKRSVALHEKTLGPNHPELATSLSNLASSLLLAGRPSEARQLFDRALAIHQKAFPADHPKIGEALVNLAAVSLVEARFAEAARLDERALSIFEKALGPEHMFVAYALTGLARANLGLGRGGEARALAERALKLREAASTPAYDLADTRFALARALWASGGDRSRARDLALVARSGYLQSGASTWKTELAEIDDWLRERSR